MITRDFAEHFAAEWVAAWNAHDLPRILSHYADDFEMASPYIARIADETSGVLKGKAAVGAYWQTALARMPELRFELKEILVGAQSLTLYYLGARGMAAEVFFFDGKGLVTKAAAHYA
jgi:ketosteroid isomerase-like protein